jgi:3-hydroxybutyryl-CoA dehydrogenase
MHIVIVGAGALGTEIAQAVALSGERITLHDNDEAALRLCLARVSRGIDHAARRKEIDALRARRAKRVFWLTTDVSDCATADVVIEALPDAQPVKQTLFQALDGVVRPNTILATTTNLIPITTLAALTRLPERVMGLHFCRPAHRMGTVEVVRSPAVRPDLIDRAVTLVRAMDKMPVLLDDSPGLIVNRVLLAYTGEALHLLDAGGLDETTIDRLMEAAGFPMGPFRLMDYLGVDKVFAVAQARYEATFHAARYRPHPRQRRLVEAGRVGRASERGGFFPPPADGKQ